MYNILSIIFLLIALFNFMHIEFKNFIFLCIISVGFAIAGAIQGIGFKLDDILKIRITVHNQINGDNEINLEKKDDILK